MTPPNDAGEGMTLDDVRDRLRAAPLLFDSDRRQLANAIDAHIAQQRTAREDAKREVVECLWSFDDDEWGTWSTGCGNAFVLTDGTPSDNDCKFCCYCGGRLSAIDAPARGEKK